MFGRNGCLWSMWVLRQGLKVPWLACSSITMCVHSSRRKAKLCFMDIPLTMCIWFSFSPVDLITNFDCRWVYVACCTIMIGIILDFKDQKYIWNPGHWQDPDWVKHFSWIKRENVSVVVHNSDNLVWMGGSLQESPLA